MHSQGRERVPSTRRSDRPQCCVVFGVAGDEGACSSDSAKFEPMPVRSVLATSGTPTGWGGSGREGKVSRKLDRQRLRRMPNLLRMDRAKIDGQLPPSRFLRYSASSGVTIQCAQKLDPSS